MDESEQVGVLYVRRRTGAPGTPPTYDVSLSADVSTRVVARVLATRDADAVLALVADWLAGEPERGLPRPHHRPGPGRAGSVTPR